MYSLFFGSLSLILLQSVDRFSSNFQDASIGTLVISNLRVTDADTENTQLQVECNVARALESQVCYFLSLTRSLTWRNF